MSSQGFLGLSAAQWLGLLLTVVAGTLAGTLLELLVVRLGRAVATRIVTEWDTKFIATLHGPGRVFLALFFFHLSTPWLDLPGEAQAALLLLVRVLLIAAATWFVLRLIALGADFLGAYLSRRVEDPSQLRAIHTQTSVPRDILRFAAVVVGVALVLLQFEAVRSIGVSLLASAACSPRPAWPGWSSAWPPSGPSATCWPASRSPCSSRSRSATPWWSRTSGAGSRRLG
jgi:hypothetical protein